MARRYTSGKRTGARRAGVRTRGMRRTGSGNRSRGRGARTVSRGRSQQTVRLVIEQVAPQAAQTAGLATNGQFVTPAGKPKGSMF